MSALLSAPYLVQCLMGRHTVQLAGVAVAMVAVTYVDMEARGVGLG